MEKREHLEGKWNCAESDEYSRPVKYQWNSVFPPWPRKLSRAFKNCDIFQESNVRLHDDGNNEERKKKCIILQANV